MKEQIEDIAKSIKRHRDLELSISASNPAYGRAAVKYIRGDTQFWIVNKENTGGYRPVENITGAVTGTASGNKTTITEDGQPIYKNSKIGEILILNHEGVHKIDTPKGQKELEIYSRTSFSPSYLDNEYATDLIIQIASDRRTHSFQNIAKILSLQIEIDEEREKLELATDEEARRLTRDIESKEAEKKTYLEKAQNFIRRYAELRYQPILDPNQEKIKRSKIFDGPLIINGGPGTGKTTSLIQRIKFLISHSIEEYITLNPSQKQLLYDQKTSWIFYSPNELLALFLRNSMKMEELTADTDRVKVWSAHKNELVKAYKLVDVTVKKPFLLYNRTTDRNLFLNNPTSINSITTMLDKYYSDFQREKIGKVIDIDVQMFKWRNTGLSIQKFLRDKKNIDQIEDLMLLFLNLEETYRNESESISKPYSDLIKQVASRIQVQIARVPSRVISLTEVLRTWKKTNQDTEDSDDDDTEMELEDFDETPDVNFHFEKDLFTRLKSICRKQSLRKFDKNVNFSRKERELIEFIPEVEQSPEYEEIGQIAFFKKSFERIIKGILPNVLREIPMIYKKFRRQQYNNSNPHFDPAILGELVKNDNNSRIHPDEQALLLYFTNGICLRLAKGLPTHFNTISHPYLTAHKAHCKPVIGVDEATDFCLIDLLAINSFGHPELSSVTLSGDIMQSLTGHALQSWGDFSQLVKSAELRDLVVSYRQSPTLLSLAQAIYEKVNGAIPNYRSYIEKDEMEPKPLMIISHEEDAKLNWIANRVIEIYKAYGDSIPSIAIFLPHENQLEEFAGKLASIDTLADVGIFVKACRNGEVLGDKDTVRVFSIDKIKGLEFEAVFFHNLDHLQRMNFPSGLLLKYLYVGLSRATFYLGMTISENINEDLKFILEYFDKTGMVW
jgi:hypothetical protein